MSEHVRGVLNAAKEIHRDYHTADVTAIIEKHTKASAMQALLEQWVETYQWQEQSVIKNTPVYHDTRKFLKKAKEVEDDKD